MATNEILATVCKAINFDADMIDRLSDRYNVKITDEQVNDALDYCKCNGDLKSLSMMLVRDIYTNFMERYKQDLDIRKFSWNPNPDKAIISYDGDEIKSDSHMRSIVYDMKEEAAWEAQKNAPREFHLTDEDKKLLREWGYPEDDLDQIELEANVCEYTQCYKSKPDRQITRDDAIRLIGRKEFLSGISRTAFHWNCGRERGNRYVHFESGIVGRHINKVV